MNALMAFPGTKFSLFPDQIRTSRDPLNVLIEYATILRSKNNDALKYFEIYFEDKE